MRQRKKFIYLPARLLYLVPHHTAISLPTSLTSCTRQHYFPSAGGDFTHSGKVKSNIAAHSNPSNIWPIAFVLEKMLYYLSVITVPLQPAPTDSFTAEEKLWSQRIIVFSALAVWQSWYHWLADLDGRGTNLLEGRGEAEPGEYRRHISGPPHPGRCTGAQRLGTGRFFI